MAGKILESITMAGGRIIGKTKMNEHAVLDFPAYVNTIFLEKKNEAVNSESNPSDATSRQKELDKYFLFRVSEAANNEFFIRECLFGSGNSYGMVYSVYYGEII